MSYDLSLFSLIYGMLFFFLLIKQIHCNLINNIQDNKFYNSQLKEIPEKMEKNEKIYSPNLKETNKKETKGKTYSESPSISYEIIEAPSSVPVTILSISLTYSNREKIDSKYNKDHLLMILIGSLAIVSIIIIIILVISIIHVKKRTLGIPELESDLL